MAIQQTRGRCPKCDKPIVSGTGFCPYCGFGLASAPAQAAPTAASPQMGPFDTRPVFEDRETLRSMGWFALVVMCLIFTINQVCQINAFMNAKAAEQRIEDAQQKMQDSLAPHTENSNGEHYPSTSGEPGNWSR